MRRQLSEKATRATGWTSILHGRVGIALVAALASCAFQSFASAQGDQPVSTRPATERISESVHFARSTDCALCHSFSRAAGAMRDGLNRNVAPFDLWSGSMMANSAVDPYWEAAVSAEVAATPTQKPHIEEVCSRCHAPMAAPISTSPDGQLLAFLRADSSKAAIGKDGVSCTVCHQISSENLGSDESFTGGFKFNNQREIYGPHSNPITMPMQHHVGYTPVKAEHILSSAMCATCHTVITESFDSQGTPTQAHLHEQVPYFEWRNSIFNDEVDSNRATARSCQSCHVPQTDVDGNAIVTRLAHNPGGRDFPFLKSREPYGRHTFAGGNVFMTQLLRDNRQALGITTPAEAFERVIEDSRKLLQNETARLSIATVRTEPRSAVVAVTVENLAGHKFPTAYPSRRAWIEMVVRDAEGKVCFSSGQTNQRGQIVDASGHILRTELASGPIQPHHLTITDSSQVQTYESLMEDSEKVLTFALLRGSRFKKDNRLLPQGWRDDHQHAQATLPQGVAEDSNFVAGRDVTQYQLSLPAGTYTTEVRLLFQSLSSRYVAELFEVDTPEVRTFQNLYQSARPVPETIATGTLQLVIPTSAECGERGNSHSQ